jgi:flagellin-like protein
MDVGREETIDRAVSSVVAVVLLVAITVVLAAGVGALAFGVGNTGDPAPEASFELRILEKSGQPDELRVTHAGGDAVSNTELYFVMEEAAVQDEDGSPTGARLSWYDVAADDGMASGAPVSAGTSVLIEPPDADPELEDKAVRIVWQPAGSDRTVTIRHWRGPAA